METLPQTKFLKLRSLGKKKPNIHGKLDNYCSIARHACACVLSLNFCIPVSTVFIQSMEMQGFGGNTVKKKSGLTRAFFKHMFCLCSCDLGDCGEHMGTMHRCPFHTVPMVNLPLSSLLVNVKLLNNKTNKKDTCVT